MCIYTLTIVRLGAMQELSAQLDTQGLLLKNQLMSNINSGNYQIVHDVLGRVISDISHQESKNNLIKTALIKAVNRGPIALKDRDMFTNHHMIRYMSVLHNLIEAGGITKDFLQESEHALPDQIFSRAPGRHCLKVLLYQNINYNSFIESPFDDISDESTHAFMQLVPSTHSDQEACDWLDLYYINPNFAITYWRNALSDGMGGRKYTFQDFSTSKTRGTTPLMHAVDQCWPLTVQKFLSHGAHVDQYNEHGNTALFKAAWGVQHQIIDILLQHGAQVQVRNNRGDTPLLHCLRNRELIYAHQDGIEGCDLKESLKKLLRATGGDYSVINYKGETALDLLSQLYISPDRPNYYKEYNNVKNIFTDAVKEVHKELGIYNADLIDSFSSMAD